MGLHHDILEHLVSRCAAIHEECGVVLIGSVARGAERTDSDIDLNIIFPRDECPLGRSPYVDDHNRWQLRVRDELQGIRIDIVAGPCLELAKEWFANHPDVASRFEQEYAAAKRQQLRARGRDRNRG